MLPEHPKVTVLIAARPDQLEIKAVAAALALQYPAGKMEILVARGRQPSAQRNAGLRAASGDLIYFLDDDSMPVSSSLQRGTAHFQKPEVQMAGGPNICPPDAAFVEQVFALVLSSRLAFGPSRARYAKVGTVRHTSEKELILCNLIARKSAMLEMGGFNEALYPNEENALMDELQKRGGLLIYDPELIVFRHPRPNLKAFMRMLMTYGRGRAEQFRAHPTFGSALNFVPPLFLLYLLTCPAGVAALGPAWLAPLGLYTLALLVDVMLMAAGGGGARAIPAAGLVVLTHVLYGFGFWRGLFTSLEVRPEADRAAVRIERVAVQ